MTNQKIKNVYPLIDELQQMTSDLPRGWCRIVSEKLAQKGEKRTARYVSDVMKGHFKNIAVVAAVIEHRNEIRELLNPSTPTSND
jgi:hypothetical protein